jgi:GDP-L-fucose synthase
MIEANVIRAAWQAGVERLLFLGSSCIYPKQAPQPMQEEYLLSGYLEPTNEPYAIAKIAGIKLCESFNRQYGTDFRCLMPTNLYGPGDNFDLESSHVLPALIRKFHLAKLAAAGDWDAVGRDQAVFGPLPQDIRQSLAEVFENAAAGRSPDGIRLWGSGTPRREFLHVDDLAAACIQVTGLPRHRYRQLCAPMTADGASGSREAAAVPHLNVGTGSDITVEALAQLVKTVVGYTGEPLWDRSMPDGTPRKWLDVSRLQRSGWSPEISLVEGLRDTYRWYCARVSAGAPASGDPEQGAGRTD